jgi:hypothetical protein
MDLTGNAEPGELFRAALATAPPALALQPVEYPGGLSPDAQDQPERVRFRCSLPELPRLL